MQYRKKLEKKQVKLSLSKKRNRQKHHSCYLTKEKLKAKFYKQLNKFSRFGKNLIKN